VVFSISHIPEGLFLPTFMTCTPDGGLFWGGNKLLALAEGGKDNNQRLLRWMFFGRFENQNLRRFENE